MANEHILIHRHVDFELLRFHKRRDIRMHVALWTAVLHALDCDGLAA